MLALKSAGELLGTCITFVIIKTETVLLKRAEPKHIKEKTFLMACTLMFFLHVLVSVLAIFFENWSFLEGYYAWFITFTTIGFGDYVQFETLQKEIDQGKSVKYNFAIYFALTYFPLMLGLGLLSCILSCLVDSLGQIRDFRDRLMNCCPNLCSPLRRALCCKGDENQVDCVPQEIS